MLKAQEIRGFRPGDHNSASRSLGSAFATASGEGESTPIEDASSGIRKLPESDDESVHGAEGGKSLIYGSTGAELRELSRRKHPSAMLCSNFLQDSIRLWRSTMATPVSNTILYI